MTKRSGQNFKLVNNQTTKQYFKLWLFLNSDLMLNNGPVGSVSSTRSTAYINIKNILIAMVFVLHVFKLSKWRNFSEYILRNLFF